MQTNMSGGATAFSYKRNQASLLAIGFVVVYILVAFVIGIVFLGIVPVLMAVNAFKRAEPLRFVALGVAIVGIVASLAFLL
jgi:hypothetical protein